MPQQFLEHLYANSRSGEHKQVLMLLNPSVIEGLHSSIIERLRLTEVMRCLPE